MFENARLKVGRAKKHIIDFHHADGEFFSSGACSFSFINDPKVGKSWFQFREHKPLPPDFALIVGDAIHNLRTALDQAVWEIISPLDPKRPQSVQFPICECADRLEVTMKSREINVAPEKIRTAIRNTKPYLGGNDDLYWLDKLDIRDKHKLVIGVLPMVAPTGFEDDWPNIKMTPELLLFFNSAIVPSDDGIIGEVPYKLPLTRRERRRVPGLDVALRAKKEKKLTAEFTSAFGRDEPLASKPVISVLARLTDAVNLAIDSIEAAIC